RRTAVRARFEEARRKLDGAGLLEALRHPERCHGAARRPVGLAYFAQQIACPFLEDESCSVHADRPLACREYLGTSPAAHCRQPSAEPVEPVPVPASVWVALARLDPAEAPSGPVRWVPLILAPEWADAHPDEPPPRPGPEWLRAALQRLTGTD